MKRTPLKRGAPLRAKTQLKRTPMKRKPARNRAAVEFSETVKREADRLAGQVCAAGLPGCRIEIQQHHHRRMKSAGGLGTLENCLPCCSPCHGHIHANPSWSYEHGYLVRSTDDPAEVPVR